MSEVYFAKSNGSYEFYRLARDGSGCYDMISVQDGDRQKGNYGLEITLVTGSKMPAGFISCDSSRRMNDFFTAVHTKKHSPRPEEKFSTAVAVPLEHLAADTLLCIIERARMNPLLPQ